MAIDVRRWAREERLRPGRRFSYSWPNRPKPYPNTVSCRTETDALFIKWATSPEQHVPIVWTKCPLGGRRPWFRCNFCGGRVGLLYSGGEKFACRRCYGLAYESQQQIPRLRRIRKAQKIREGLGGTANLLQPFPEKPRGMHWRTYNRIKQVYETAYVAGCKAHDKRPAEAEQEKQAKEIYRPPVIRPPVFDDDDVFEDDEW